MDVSEESSSNGVAATPRYARGDIGRRLAQRREELRLTREEVAARAGMAPGYLRYLEEQPTAAPNLGSLLRLASALETSVPSLSGGEADLPPVIGRAGGHPELIELSPEECWSRLSTHGVGRIAVSTAEGQAILPVNYTAVGNTIVFRTMPDAGPAAAEGKEVAFEVDRIDEAMSQGWSVLVRGPARAVTDPEAVRRLAEAAYSAPWAGGARDLWLRIDPVRVTGRRIRVR